MRMNNGLTGLISTLVIFPIAGGLLGFFIVVLVLNGYPHAISGISFYVDDQLWLLVIKGGIVGVVNSILFTVAALINNDSTE